MYIINIIFITIIYLSIIKGNSGGLLSFLQQRLSFSQRLFFGHKSLLGLQSGSLGLVGPRRRAGAW